MSPQSLVNFEADGPVEIRNPHDNTWILMDVTEPVTITTEDPMNFKNKTFTTYLIRLETNHESFLQGFSSVRRRYSEFVWLRNKLCQRYSSYKKLSIPALPPKRYLQLTKFNAKVLEKRRVGLGKFLYELLSSPQFQEDGLISMFCQSSLSVGEIEEKLSAGVLGQAGRGYLSSGGSCGDEIVTPPSSVFLDSGSNSSNLSLTSASITSSTSGSHFPSTAATVSFYQPQRK